MKKFTARFITPNGTKTLSNCTIIDGYVCGTRREGVGEGIEKGGITAGGDGDTWIEYESYEDAPYPITNASAIEALGMTATEFESYCKKLDRKAVYDEKVRSVMLRLGENPFGRIVEDLDAIEEMKKSQAQTDIAEKKAPIEFGNSYGLRIITQLPRDIWEFVRPFSRYQKWDEEDADSIWGYGATKSEVIGWVYEGEAIEVLTKKGFPCTYSGKPITCIADVYAINAELQEKYKQEQQVRQEIKRLDAEFQKLFKAMQTPENYQRCKDCFESDNARQLPNIKVGTWKGSDIYGGGKWFNIIGDDLYIVHNNGMDGDNWEYNNYITGGAGAMGWKVIGGAVALKTYQDWINSLGELAKELR
jgi:hypothetical protein